MKNHLFSFRFGFGARIGIHGIVADAEAEPNTILAEFECECATKKKNTKVNWMCGQHPSDE